MFTPQRQDLHKIKVNPDQGQTSKASPNGNDTVSVDAKGKAKVEEYAFQDIYAYAQYPHDIIWDTEYSKLMEYDYLQMLERKALE